MSALNRTPGPLHAREGDDTVLSGLFTVAIVLGRSLEERRANALLFAAAPDLYDICQAVLDADKAHFEKTREYLLSWGIRVQLTRSLKNARGEQ